MRIVYIAAGAGTSYCGACARDVTLARKLSARGHDVLFVPLYTPLEVDGPDPSLRRVFYGGIATYLQQRFALFRRRWPLVDSLLDMPWLLRAVSRHAIETRPEGLGEMTVSVLRGPEGRQAKELRELLGFLAAQARPDVVNLTNSLISAIAPAVKERLGVPVLCTLQGEEAFVSRLGAPRAAEAAALLRRNAAAIDLFVAPSPDYAAEMSAFLRLPRERFQVVRPGVDIDVYSPRPPAATPAPAGPVRVGCLSRISPSKGADLLCDAALAVERRRPGAVALALAGQLAPVHKRWWSQSERRVRAGSLGPRFECWGEVSLERKVEFLRRLDVFVQPSRIVERRGVAALEALACGLPLVLPRAGIFTEIVELTGAGALVEPGNLEALTDTLLRLVADPAERLRLSAPAPSGAARYYSADRLADETIALYEQLLRK